MNRQAPISKFNGVKKIDFACMTSMTLVNV